MMLESENLQNAGQTTFGLEVALTVWHRRKWLAVLVFVAVLSVTAPLPFKLPDIYESTATVLVEHQQLPGDALGGWGDSALETRLRTISERILSRSRLNDLITRFGLYPELQQRAAPEVVAEQMRRDIQIQFNGVRQPTGLDATVAFSLSYRGRNPETVAQVTNALAALYVEENTKMRAQQTAGAAEFLQGQLDDARRQLNAQEQNMNAFRERHIGELPEQQSANLAALGRLNDQLRVIQTRRDELTKPVTGAAGAGGYTIPARLARLQQELADLRTRDTDEHPDVVRVKQEIAALERQLATRSAGQAVADPTTSSSASADAAEVELRALRAQEQQLQSQIATYEHRVENAPLIEQELQQVTRDYTAARDLYQSLLQRYEGAQLAERMNQRLQGEQFSILDPAVTPQRPVGPHRARFVMMAFLISVGAGVGAALLGEASDTSFHTVDDVRAFTTVPVLGSIPPIITVADARRRRRQFLLAAIGAALGVALLVAGSSHIAQFAIDPLIRLLMPVRS
jgi:polysaccharide biosynthesis transport protein